MLALLCIVLSILTIVAMMPGMAYADDKTDGNAAQSGNTETTSTTTSQTWDHSKSKTATKLTKDSNGDLTSEVTLSLPSKEEQLSSEVCFVLDKSSFSDTQEPAMKLLNELKSATSETGAKVQVDIVEFNRIAHDHGSYDLATQYDKIESAFKKQNSGGTNMHAGLLMAQEVLGRNTSIPDNRKYMVLVSDGDSYLYCKDGNYNKAYSRSYIPVESAGGSAYGGYYDEGWYCPSNGYEDKESGKQNVKRPTTSSQRDWEAYLNDVRDRNQESNGNKYDFEWKYYDNSWMLKTPDEVTKDEFKTQPAVPRSASNLDMGLLNAASAYHTLAAKYHCYAMAASSWNKADGGHSAFMQYLDNGAPTAFESIKNQILYLVDKGSTVTDTIGDQFDLTDPAQMKLTIVDEQGNSKTYDAEKIDENHYGFLPQQGDKKYAYEVVYTPDNKDTKIGEKIDWTTNVPITNFQHVSLTYQVKLKEPKTEPGTYGQLDLNGDGIIDRTSTSIDTSKAIYTNESAILQPKDSGLKDGTSEEFGKPSVSYTVEKTTPTTPTEPTKPEEHTITFQPNNGQPTFTQTVPDGGQAVLPDEPSKKGYKFIGWYTDSALTKAYDFSTPVKSNLTLYAKWKKGIPTTKQSKKVTGILLPKVIAKGKHTQVLTWTALKNVDGYFIYTNHCDEGRLLHPFKKVADYKASKARVYTKRHLTTYDNYKYYVAAYKIKHSKKVIVRNSVTVHSVCGNTSARSTNVKAVKAAKHAITLKKGQSYKLKASIYKINKSRAFLDTTHCGLIRYLSRDKKIATVDYNTGKIKGVKAGTTKVYVLGVNGIRDRVTVTVK